MDPLLIVSPHLDDAVISCGQLMAGRPDCVVVTVFAGTPDRVRQLTTYDQACGFVSAAHAMLNRRAEDAAAVSGLGGRYVHLDYIDHQYREVDGLPDPAPADIATKIAYIVDTTEHCGVVLGPLGLAHPDHVLVARAFAIAVSIRTGWEAWLYEDLPSRVLWPEQAAARLDRWRDRGYEPALEFLGTGDLNVKDRAVRQYGSQLDSLRAACGGNLHPVLVPERFHRVPPRADR